MLTAPVTLISNTVTFSPFSNFPAGITYAPFCFRELASDGRCHRIPTFPTLRNIVSIKVSYFIRSILYGSIFYSSTSTVVFCSCSVALPMVRFLSMFYIATRDIISTAFLSMIGFYCSLLFWKPYYWFYSFSKYCMSFLFTKKSEVSLNHQTRFWLLILYRTYLWNRLQT